MKYFRDRIAGSETLQALASFSVLMAVQVGGNLATLAYTLIFVRLLTPEQFGTVSSLWAMSLILVPFAMLNLAPVAIQAVVKARQQGDDALAAGFFRFARRVVLYSSPLVIALFVALAPWGRAALPWLFADARPLWSYLTFTQNLLMHDAGFGANWLSKKLKTRVDELPQVEPELRQRGAEPAQR